jgi:dynein heavy chain
MSVLSSCSYISSAAAAMAWFVRQNLGRRFIESIRRPLDKILATAPPATPVLFVLSSGSDPAKEVEELATKMDEDVAVVSIGEGQEQVATAVLHRNFQDGGWAYIHNVHLAPAWASGKLCVIIDTLETCHARFRLFMSTEQSSSLPVAVLQASHLISSRAPEGLLTNIRNALEQVGVTDEALTTSGRPAEMQQITTCVCIFHAAALARKAYGTAGWNQPYPFSQGDLLISIQSAVRSLNDTSLPGEAPWYQIRHMAGEVFYGGNITDSHDRLLARTYLEMLLNEDNASVGAEILPGLPAPKWGLKQLDLLEHLYSSPIRDSPATLLMNPNVEVSIRLEQGTELFESISELHPGPVGQLAGVGASVQERASIAVEDILEQLPPIITLNQTRLEAEGANTYAHVFMQEISRASLLTSEIRSTLTELGKCLTGEIQTSEVRSPLRFNPHPCSMCRIWFHDLRADLECFPLLRRPRML